MKKLLLTLVLFVCATCAAHAFVDSYTIDRDKLPEEAQKMLSEYFPKAKIGMIKVDRHLLKKTDYDVRLTNGTKIEFKNSGKWSSVDCKNREVPSALVPKAISRHVSKNFSGVKIVKIKKKSSGYEIELSDGVELKYNLLGQLKKIDLDD